MVQWVNSNSNSNENSKRPSKDSTPGVTGRESNSQMKKSSSGDNSLNVSGIINSSRYQQNKMSQLNEMQKLMMEI
tara:strand:- start:106 stop:330 length:225 start_codon:yes stop_codon:yes gene_type:complete